jgi:hypothetical protein
MRRRASRARAAVIVAGAVGAVGAAAGIGAQTAAVASTGDDQGESTTVGTGRHPAYAAPQRDDEERASRAAGATPTQPRLSQGNPAQAPQAQSSGS